MMDKLREARGIINGVVLGAMIWGAIIVALRTVQTMGRERGSCNA